MLAKSRYVVYTLHAFVAAQSLGKTTLGQEQRIMWTPAIKVLLIFAASFLTYMNSLDAGFVFDDHRGILTNDDLDPSKTSLWDVFQHDFWGGSIARAESHKSYRPLTVLSYRYLNYYFTELRPYSYHLVNVFMHGLCSVLFLAVAELVLGRRGGTWWAVFAASLFAVHSIHTEAVRICCMLTRAVHCTT